MQKRKQDSIPATLFKLEVYLNDKGHLEIQREYLHPNDWLKIISDSYPSYEHKDVMYKFLNYSKDLMDRVEKDLRTYSPMLKLTHHRT